MTSMFAGAASIIQRYAPILILNVNISNCCFACGKILTLFLDVPGDAACIYAIHNIVQAGVQYDKLPGTMVRFTI
jgi:hypothetical protein